MKRFVWCTTSFIGFHKWPNAPNHVDYLRNLHRHVFHVKVMVNVGHADRDIEFITLKQAVDSAIEDLLMCWDNTQSCEQIADNIYSRLNDVSVYSIYVSEDNENGAMTIYE